MEDIDCTFYFEKVPQEVAPKDGKVYYYLNKRNYQIIEESVLRKAFDNEYKDSNFIFLSDKKL